MLPTAVILGDLNVLRCFAGTRTSATVCSSDPANPTFFSRYCAKKLIINDPIRQPDHVVDQLIGLARSLDEKPVLYYGNDTSLLLISRHRDRLAQHYRFLMPDAETIEDLVSKTRFADLAQRIDLPVPRTRLSTDFASSHDALRELQLPIILKPNFRVGWFDSGTIKSEGGKPQKVLRADTEEKFHGLWTKIQRFSPDFVLQEYIPGPDDCIYSFHAYYNADSQPLAWYVGRKIRTWPRDSGLSTYVELVKEPAVAKLGMDILRKLNFVGVAKIDFKLDPRTNKYYLLEINPRFSLWNRLAAACGVNLATIAYHDLLGRPIAQPTDYRTNLRWLSFLGDAKAFLADYHPDGTLSWSQWLASFCCPKVYDYFAWTDPMPFIITTAQYAGAFAVKWSKRLAGLRHHLGHPRKPRSAECCAGARR